MCLRGKRQRQLLLTHFTPCILLRGTSLCLRGIIWNIMVITHVTPKGPHQCLYGVKGRDTHKCLLLYLVSRYRVPFPNRMVNYMYVDDVVHPAYKYGVKGIDTLTCLP